MKMLAIDGNSILNRAYYGIKPLTNKNGVYTNAVFGFMNIYLKALAEYKPDRIAVAFDVRKPTFRHEAVAAYKANRKGMPEELAMQLPLVKQLLSALGISVLECPGFEGDDILGTLARVCFENECDCVILTGDKDSLQLINKRVSVALAGTRETRLVGEDEFFADYGFEPQKLIDLKALMGDSSDNISGVAGIGEKTAMTLIRSFGTIEQLYEAFRNADLTSGVKTKLENGKGSAFESKWLATIRSDVPVSDIIDDYLPAKADDAAASRLLTELEMFRLSERLGLPLVSAAAPEKVSVTAEAPQLKFAEPDDFTDFDFSLPFGIIAEGDCLRCCLNNKIYIARSDDNIKKLLLGCKNASTFGAKTLYRKAFELGIEPQTVASDAEISAYLLKSSAVTGTVSDLCGEFSCSRFDELGENADVHAVIGLCSTLRKTVDENGMSFLLDEIELPLTKVLASMEHTGVRVDKKGIISFGETLKTEMKSLETEIYDEAGHEFNISSPKQLGTILFEERGLRGGKKTKTGYSTNVDVLEKLSDYDRLIPMILRYRKLSKLDSTYVEGLLKKIADDGRIHSCFKQTETRTGRISSTEPNVQNIPVRTELGRNMRKFFVSDSGKLLLDADYSQIELRLLAHLCNDKNMKNAFSSGTDIHSSTAAQVFNLPLMMVTPAMRTAAKAVNFGIIYGIGAFSLSKDIGVSVAEADRYIKDYLRNYPGIARYMSDTVESAKKNGFATTMFGRRRYIPELASTNKNIQSFGKRAAMNAPVQGSAADIIKIAMVRTYERLKSEGINAHLVLQVHDELIVEADEACTEAASAILGEEMRNAAELSVPLATEVNCGKSWFDAKG